MGAPNFPQTPAISLGLTLDSAASTTLTTLRTCAATNGEIIGRLRAASTEAAAITLQFTRNIGGVDRVIGESQVAAGAGTNGATSYKDILADINGGLPLTLASGEILKVKAKTAVSGSYKIDITGEGAPL